MNNPESHISYVETIITYLPIIIIIVITCLSYYLKQQRKKLKNSKYLAIQAKIKEIQISGNTLKLIAIEGSNTYTSDPIHVNGNSSGLNEELYKEEEHLIKNLENNISTYKNLISITLSLGGFPIGLFLIIFSIIIFSINIKKTNNYEFFLIALLALILGIIVIIKAKKSFSNLKKIRDKNQAITEHLEQCNINGNTLKIGDSITIYINPKNPEDYRIDTEFS